MTSFDRFERNLPDLLEALAAPRRPDYAEDLFARTAATRQRPGWTFLERWLPMSALTRSLARVPRVPWRLGAVVALLAVAALVAVLVAGALRDRTPPPYGPATNGHIVYVDLAGRVLAGDLSTGTATVFVDQGGGSSPTYSQDGRRIAFLRESPTSSTRLDLMVVDADGTNLVQLDREGIGNPQFFAWSGRGDQILVLDAAGRMLLFDTIHPGDPIALSDKLGVAQADIGPGGYNSRSTVAFRPPRGDEILFVDMAGRGTLQAVHPDGSGLRTLIDPTTTSVPYIRVRAAEWSPDGTQVVVLLQQAGTPDQSRTYVLNADGTNLHPLSPLSTHPLIDTNSPRWSPDGTRIAFQYWFRHVNDLDQDFNPIGIVDVATGAEHDVGRVFPSGFVSWEWSPDGTSILEVPGDGSGDILIVDAATGAVTTAPWTAAQPISWQRVAH